MIDCCLCPFEIFSDAYRPSLGNQGLSAARGKLMFWSWHARMYCVNISTAIETSHSPSRSSQHTDGLSPRFLFIWSYKVSKEFEAFSQLDDEKNKKKWPTDKVNKKYMLSMNRLHRLSELQVLITKYQNIDFYPFFKDHSFNSE